MAETVTPDVCKLHREVIDAKIETLKAKDDSLDARMERIEDGITEVRTLQKTILYALIGIAFGVVATLFGVILGRGIDFGWLIP
jgi:hypothetical protein